MVAVDRIGYKDDNFDFKIKTIIKKALIGQVPKVNLSTLKISSSNTEFAVGLITNYWHQKQSRYFFSSPAIPIRRLK